MFRISYYSTKLHPTESELLNWYFGMITIEKGILSIALLVMSLFIPSISSAQSYGLGFHSHTEVQDKRTSLDLFPAAPWCPGGDFELSFDLSFLPGYEAYFGYIFRMIADDRKNIDFIYDERSNLHNRFKMVLGEDLTRIAFDLDSNRMFRKWNTFRIKFDLHADKIIFSINNSTYVQEKVGLTPGSCFKLYFGANQYKQFQVTDVPPMKIRNLQLTQNETTRFSFPLDERESTVAHEMIHHADGKVLNPVWIRDEHYTWKEEEDILLNGYASVAFDPKTERLFIADGDSLLTWTAPTGRLSGSAYATGPQPLLRGNQSLYSPSTNSLYNLYIDQSLVTAFDFNRSVWDKDHHPGPVTDYWHFNKFYSPTDTSLYLLGGYGHFQYRNIILRYHLSTQKWDTLTPTGDRLVPRYLFALGATAAGDSVYILGGYGSQTGQQILNPQNIYDMMVLDVRHRKLKKLFELQPKSSDFAFANSLVLDSRKRNYYGLVFPNSRYASHLQLIRGALDGPGYQDVGDTIPYSFHDVSSASDLYFAPLSNKFLAITQLIDTLKRTHLHIYSLSGPPVTAEAAYPTLSDGQSSSPVKYVWSTLLLAFVGAGTWFMVKRRAKTPAFPSSEILQSEDPSQMPTPSQVAPTQTPSFSAPAETSTIPDPINTLFLFGEMQIFDKDGIDLTRQFTPLLRELLLLILLYSVRKGTGVSSDKLTEVLWSDKSTQAARNNRSVNIAKLKTLLDRLEGVHLSKETGYWKIDLDPITIRLDYQTYLNIVKDKNHLNKQRINELSEITQRGSFLSNIEYEWLDEFKSEVSNTIIDTYLHFAQSIPLKEDPDFLVRLANYVFYFDPVNEEAITIKCKALAFTGKHSLAKNAFDGFTRQYRTIYGEDYGKDFQTLLDV